METFWSKVGDIVSEETKSESFLGKANQLAKEFAKIGLVAEGYMPTKLFHEICYQFGIWRWENLDASGRTNVN